MDRIGPFLYDIIVEKGGLNMYKVKLCLGTNGQFGLKDEEQILLFHKFGFDGFFTGWKKGQNIKKNKRFSRFHQYDLSINPCSLFKYGFNVGKS